MRRKIIGITVGSTLPKPNLMQADPSKGDYVNGKEAIPTKVSQLENDSKYINETELPVAIDEALKQAKESGQFTPVKGEDYFTDADKKEFEDDIKESVPMVLYDAQTLTDEQKQTARENIGATGADLAEEVLGTIARPRNVQFLRAGDIIQMKTTLDDGQTEITQIKLDAYEKPMTIEKDGITTHLTWEGFD